MYIETALVLNTGHLPKVEMNAEEDFGSCRAIEHEYGYIVFVCLTDDPHQAQDFIEEAPAWFQPILAEAIHEKHNYINFDQDAPTNWEFHQYRE